MHLSTIRKIIGITILNIWKSQAIVGTTSMWTHIQRDAEIYLIHIQRVGVLK